MATKIPTRAGTPAATKKAARKTPGTTKPMAKTAAAPKPPTRKPSVVETVAKVIEDSPVGKAGAVTSAVLRSRREIGRAHV